MAARLLNGDNKGACKGGAAPMNTGIEVIVKILRKLGW